MPNDSASPRRTQSQTDYLDPAKLRALRETARPRLSQERLALAAGTKQGRLAHMEAGDDGCGIELLAALASALGDALGRDVNPEELMHAAGVERYRALMTALKAA